MSEKRKKLTSRETLRNYFNTGCLPKAKHFHDLIDSTLNMEDEGFNKTPEDGLQVFTRGGESSLLSFFREGVDLGVPLWRVRFDTGRDSLQFAHILEVKFSILRKIIRYNVNGMTGSFALILVNV